MRPILSTLSCLALAGLLVMLADPSMLHAQKRGKKRLRTAPRTEQQVKETVTLRCDPEEVVAATVIQYMLSRSGKVSVKVFDESGREVATLDNQRRNVGLHQVIFDRRDLPAGIYHCTVKSGSVTVTKKLVLLDRPE